MTILEMKAARAKAFEQLKALCDKADSEERDLAAEEQEAYDKINAEIDQFGLDVSKAERAERVEAVMHSLETPESRKAGMRNPNEVFLDEVRAMLVGESRAIEARYTGQDVADLDRKHGRKEERDLLTTGTGANAIPVSFIRSLREHLIENSGVRQTNVTILVTEGGEPLRIPKSTAHPTAVLIGEGTAITESDPTLAQVTLDAFKYANIQQLSGEFVSDEVVNVLAYLARQNGIALGNGSGAHFVTGTGTGQPRGVQTAAAVGKTGAAGQVTTVTGDDLIDLVHSIVSGYRRNAFWLMNDASLAKVRKLKDSQGQYLWQPGLQAGIPDLLLARPVVTDPNMPVMAANAKSILFGDFSTYYIRDVGSVRIERSDDFAFNTDLVTFRAILRTDGDLIDENGVKAYQNAAV